MTALRHVPGHVVVLSSGLPTAPFEESYLSAVAELLVTSQYQLGTERQPRNVGLDVYLVNAGEELRFLEHVRSQPGVIAASVNYVGVGLDESHTAADATTPAQDYPELVYGAGRPAKSVLQCLLWSGDSEAPECLTDEQLLERRRSLPERLIATVDVTVDHCKDVMTAIAEGYASAFDQPRARPCILGMTAADEQGRFTDVFGFGDRLLRLAELAGPRYGEPIAVHAINMSVDFGQIIRGYEEVDRRLANYPCAIASIPVLEEICDLASEILTREVGDELEGEVGPGRKPRLPRASPALFAAAGNRTALRAEPRNRMGYPAIRPEIIAATFVTAVGENPEFVALADAVDAPATSALKPCFAVDLAQRRVSRSDGSSFACAWLSGYYSALNGQSSPPPEQLGRFSKAAWLMRQARRREIVSANGTGHLPNFVQVIGSSRRQDEARAPGEADKLIDELSRNFHVDFCLFGSTATVTEWLRLHDKSISDISTVLRKDLGDIDLLHTRGLDASQREAVKDFAQNWFKQKIGRAWVQDRKRPVELHLVPGLAGVGERLRSVVPATRLHVTRCGLIDVWGGLSDLQNRRIRLVAMTEPALWEENKLFSTGADCLALNILQWIGCTLLLRLVSIGVGVEPPSLAPESLDEVEKIFRRAGSSSRKRGVPLFGGGQKDLRERVDRRFERVETLMGSCARHGPTDLIFDEVTNSLRELRPQ
jgi:hypothetical protein